MNLHEYQAKILLKNNDVRVLAGNPVLNDNEIDSAVDSIQTPVMVVKSQIHAGGRGAGKFKDSGDDKGGVRVCFSKEEACWDGFVWFVCCFFGSRNLGKPKLF